MVYEYQTQRPLREIVYLELKHKILIGEIPSMTRLMEIDLAEKMNVSRTPIREAIRQLESDGLVVIEPRKGAYVSKIAIADLLDIMEVREDLEGLAAALAAERINDEQRLVLNKLTRLYELAIENNDKDKIVEGDEKFHKYIVQCSGNNTLIQMVNQVQELSLRFRYLYYDDYAEYVRMPEVHKHIRDAICTGNAEIARKEATLHIRNLRDFVLKLAGDEFEGIGE